MDKFLTALTGETQKLLPIAGGSIAGTLLQRSASPYLVQVPVVGEHKEFHSLVIMVAGLMAKQKRVGGSQMNDVWTGVIISGVVSLADNLALRVGIDLL